ncbi:hypothetical protein CY652_01330 [Burkholderia sp. WAC0059]|uniref:hypothetical protein n=1 Tax=Burkholderia sp. WAC0059 TaxID=2066022 RepID=UPI000C7ED0DD|nr:hypothetical protein [Burkholderia sp. WAC0059]PLZ04342.1 hypothetical protein CY652_01330 [Burkholderia sp. WAC0059]
MKIGMLRAVSTAVSFVFIAGCSMWAGPMQDTEAVTMRDGTHAMKVQCEGLFGSTDVCVKQMQKVCTGRQVRILEITDTGRLGLAPAGRARELTFACEGGAPQRK